MMTALERASPPATQPEVTRWLLRTLTALLTSNASDRPVAIDRMDLPLRLALTPRERQVAELIARGRTNRQIADELVIALSTAERHVANILRKLQVSSRAQVVAWMLSQGGNY